MKKIVTFLNLALLSSPVFAHAGHDHSHWSSVPMHLIAVGAILIVLMMATRIVKKYSKAKKKLLRTNQG